MNNTYSIALFGGTFNPPHNGHLNIAKKTIESNLAEEVIFIPAAHPSHKSEKPIEKAQKRYEMIESLIKDENNLSLSNYEIVNKRQASYTYYTLKAFQAIYPNKKIKLIIGADNLWNFDQWYNYQKIFNNFEIIIFQRPNNKIINLTNLKNTFGQKIAQKISKYIIELNINISSTKIRKLLKDNQNISELIPANTLAYIKKNNLYKI